MGTKTTQDRALRLTSSQDFLNLFTSDQDKFVRHIITGDETWWATGTQKVNKSRCSRDMLHLLHQANSKHSHQLARLWRPSFWIAKVCCWSIICQIKIQWMDCIMPICCRSCARQSRINDVECYGAWSGWGMIILQSTSLHCPACCMRLSLGIACLLYTSPSPRD